MRVIKVCWMSVGIVAFTWGCDARPGQSVSFPTKADSAVNCESLEDPLEHRKATRNTTERNDNCAGIVMVYCSPGEFLMGSPPSELKRSSNEQGKHGGPVKVQLSQGFWLGQTEITQEQWQTVMDTRPWLNFDFSVDGPQFPACNISHSGSPNSAVDFCKTLTQLEIHAGRISAELEYRLPTEAEWEYACRAGTLTAYSFGDSPRSLDTFGWWGGLVGQGNATAKRAYPVAQKKPNGWGFYDMHGNVAEWCADRYQLFLPGGRDPCTSFGSEFAARGGGWDYPADTVRSSWRIGIDPNYRGNSTGFRIALGVKE